MQQHENETHTVCQDCGGSFWFPDEGLGMTAACPHCGLEMKLEPRSAKVEIGNVGRKAEMKPESERIVARSSPVQERLNVPIVKRPSNSKHNPWLIIIALLLLTGIILHEREIKRSESPKWAYESFKFDKDPTMETNYRFSCDTYFARLDDGSSGKPKESYHRTLDSVVQILDFLGTDGWEFVGYIQGEYVVKRQQGVGEWNYFIVIGKYDKK